MSSLQETDLDQPLHDVGDDLEFLFGVDIFMTGYRGMMIIQGYIDWMNQVLWLRIFKG